MLLDVQMLTICISLALASKFYMAFVGISTLQKLLTFNNILSLAFSKICPGCSAPNNQVVQLSLPSLYSYNFWSDLMYQGIDSISCTFLCSMKVMLIVLIHQCISRSVSYAVIALLFIDLRSLILMGRAVVVVNILLTISVCWYLDARRKQMAAKEAAMYYERWILGCKVLAPTFSILLGIYFGL
jgi:hypothetical protein